MPKWIAYDQPHCNGRAQATPCATPRCSQAVSRVLQAKVLPRSMQGPGRHPEGDGDVSPAPAQAPELLDGLEVNAALAAADGLATGPAGGLHSGQT